MLETYLLHLDIFLRKVKFAIVALGSNYLDGIHYCCAEEKKYELSYLLFSGIQVLSYLRENETANAGPIKAVVSHILTLIDLSDVGLEPYNLYLRATRRKAVSIALWDGDLPISSGKGGLLIGNGVVTTSPTYPSVYEQEPAPSLTSPL